MRNLSGTAGIISDYRERLVSKNSNYDFFWDGFFYLEENDEDGNGQESALGNC